MSEINVLSFPSFSDMDLKKPLPEEYKGFAIYEIGGKIYSEEEFYSLFSDEVLPPKIEVDKECKHEWEVVGHGMNGNEWINCKKCDMAKEDYIGKKTTKEIPHISYNNFWD